MGTGAFRSGPRDAVDRAKDLRTDYLRDLLLRAWRALKAWQPKPAPADGTPVAATPTSGVVILFAPAAAGADRCTTREQSNAPLAGHTRHDRVGAEAMQEAPIPSVAR